MNRRLTICGILVKHKGCASFDLSFEDRVPEFLGFNRLTTFALLLVSLIKLLEFLASDVSQARSLVRAEERPFGIGLDPLHAAFR